MEEKVWEALLGLCRLQLASVHERHVIRSREKRKEQCRLGAVEACVAQVTGMCLDFAHFWLRNAQISSRSEHQQLHMLAIRWK